MIGNGDGTSGNVIEGNYIGTDATGMMARPNSYSPDSLGAGIWFLGAGANIVGGVTPEGRNVISGNGTGVYISDGTTGVQIEGNYIGVNANGTAALGNQGDGIEISGPSGALGNGTDGSANNTIGGTATGAANVISGNGGYGSYDVDITASASTGNVVEGNYIGTGVKGIVPLSNGIYVFVVTSTAESGAGSLRQAILNADAFYGTASITFDIPTSDPGYNASTGTWIITPASALPIINEAVALDATTQPGYSTRPLIALDGVDAGSGVTGFIITGGHSTVQGLVIDNFSGNGIEIDGGGNNVIATNYIGVDATGSGAAGNGGNGIALTNTSDNTIGGTTAARNVISGNQARRPVDRFGHDRQCRRGQLHRHRRIG